MTTQTLAPAITQRRSAWSARLLGQISLALAGLLLVPSAHAQETVCARVKIEIKQELTLERQAFDAEMKINNTTDSGVIENVGVVVKVTDESGTPVHISDNPDDLSAKFFIRVSNKENISDVTGSGTVAAKTTAIINWLLIPAPGAAGGNPLGKKYLVGATLTYRYGGENQTLDLSPDVITVKPLPLLTLDYFLQEHVWADDPLTPEIEPTEPFTLGVRVKNNGQATAKNLKIDSAQPKIIENNMGLLINFTLTGSFVDDAPTQNTLLINFGDIAASTSKMGRWNMESTLAGKFTEFTARFTHADELGGAMTSILQATNAHMLIRDVRVDLPGRDLVKDFLAQDGDVLRVYESDSEDTEVTDRSAVAQLNAVSSGQTAQYSLSFPPTAGFVYVKLRDPFNGSKALGTVRRSDAKTMLADNVWLSKTRNEQSKQWEHWVNFFDVNTTGSYNAEFQAPSQEPRPPVLQFIPERSVREEQQVSFLVEASSPDGLAVLLSAAPLPVGATLTPQAADPTAPGVARALFDWTPAKGSAGSYLISYTATDGERTATRSASIKVLANDVPAGPAQPEISAPVSGAHVTSLQPTLAVLASGLTTDPTRQIQFELYQDEAMSQLVDSAVVDKAPALPGQGGGQVVSPTSWKLTQTLSDNTHYWWRARAYDGTQTYSPWVHSRLFVNLYNDAPDLFDLSSPAPLAEVADLNPVFSWANARDKDGDAVSYTVVIYSDGALTQEVQRSAEIVAQENGQSSWTSTLPLNNHGVYYWRVTATDALGAQTLSLARPFTVNTGNHAPTAAQPLSPIGGVAVPGPTVTLVAQNGLDADGDLITLVYEIDTVDTFDSPNRRTSGQVMQSAGETTSWTATELIENQPYHWRVKTQDGRAESAWAAAAFQVSASNQAPPAPTVKNPGNAAWTSTLQPTLEAHPVVDPEGQTVQYQFEVFRDAALMQLELAGSSATTAWTLPQDLTDKSTHWWRVRAVDELGAASAWSAAAILYVSTGPYQDPVIQLTSPSQPLRPTDTEGRQTVLIEWEGTNPNIEPTVALYYSTSKAAYGGTAIVDGLKQPVGTHRGQYTWDVSQLPVGTYYVYAEIYDARGVGRAWAPGAVVVSPAQQTGRLLVNPSIQLMTSEDGLQARFFVQLGSRPTHPVTVPVASANRREGIASPASLTFTSTNWGMAQVVTVTGQPDCVRNGSSVYQVVVGRPVSEDPQYMGMASKSVNLSNLDSALSPAVASNLSSMGLCGIQVVSSRKIDVMTWEYEISALAGNSGPSYNGVTATLLGTTMPVQLLNNKLEFGAMGTGETARSKNTIVLRSRTPLSDAFFNVSVAFRWSVSVQ